MTALSVWGARGGMGCTTTALLLAKTGIPAVVYDQVFNDGFDVPKNDIWSDNSAPTEWSDTPGPWDLKISDRGPISEESRWDLSDRNIIVLRGPTYLGLKTLVGLSEYWVPYANKITVLVIKDKNSILKGSDVADVLENVKVVTMPATDAIARLSDRGMICDIEPLADESDLLKMLQDD